MENVDALNVDLTSGNLSRIDDLAPKDAFGRVALSQAMMELLNR